MMAPDDLSKSIKHRWNEAIGKELYAFFSRNVSKLYLFSAESLKQFLIITDVL